MISENTNENIKRTFSAGRFYNTEIDIGCGLGAFSLAAARERPANLIIGIDLNESSFSRCESERKKQGLRNVHFFHAEAMRYISTFVPDRSISAFHMYFPTPYTLPLVRGNVLGSELGQWLLTAPFLAELSRAAAVDAVFRFATDHQAYFEYASNLIQAAGLVAEEWSDPIKTKRFGELIGTGCEQRQRKIGYQVNSLQCRFL